MKWLGYDEPEWVIESAVDSDLVDKYNKLRDSKGFRSERHLIQDASEQVRNLSIIAIVPSLRAKRRPSEACVIKAKFVGADVA